ncbi:SdiA-regulated family protein [Mucilaginibacter sp. dw_454]|uniref:SdiA-regulated family protein n=1 Tax=Mucilaginibacter sp. dw_454 TaxID=2720079 RepID=UPI001BD3E9A1|nr:SdiA-regulated family protein [Mucilaginibacter sp. dw_454]
MKNTRGIILILSVLLTVFVALSCIDKRTFTSPPGYDLNNPVKYFMTDNLTEISGIAFRHGKPDSIYAEQDEEGKVYYFKLGDKKPAHSRFGKPGDFEDIAILNDQVVMLRSDGVLFVFPFNQVRSAEILAVQKLNDILPTGEYEGLFADERSNQLYVLCKHCNVDNTRKTNTGYIFRVAHDGSVKQSGQFVVSVKDIEAKLDGSKIAFHPSAFAKNQNTNEWYIVSSVNKIIVVTDANFKVKNVYPIDPALFIQPEGIAFDNQNNLYISNEGSKTAAGTIYKFNYKK